MGLKKKAYFLIEVKPFRGNFTFQRKERDLGKNSTSPQGAKKRGGRRERVLFPVVTKIKKKGWWGVGGGGGGCDKGTVFELQGVCL